MEKETKTKEKIITARSKEDKVFCKCGEEMEPIILSQYKCPKAKWYHFFLFFFGQHSLPKLFIRKKDEIGFTIETSLKGLKEIAEGLEEVLKTGESVRKGDTIQFNHKGKTLFDIKLT